MIKDNFVLLKQLIEHQSAELNTVVAQFMLAIELILLDFSILKANFPVQIAFSTLSCSRLSSSRPRDISVTTNLQLAKLKAGRIKMEQFRDQFWGPVEELANGAYLNTDSIIICRSLV